MTDEKLEKLIKLQDELKKLKNIAYAMRNFNSLVIITKFPHDRIQIDDCDIIKSMTEAGLKIVEKDYEEKEKLFKSL